MNITMTPTRYAALYAIAAAIAGGLIASQFGWIGWLAAVPAFAIFIGLDILYTMLPDRMKTLAPWLGLLGLFLASAALMLVVREVSASDQPTSQTSQALASDAEAVARVYMLFQAELQQQATKGGHEFDQMEWLKAVQACHLESPSVQVTPSTMTTLRECAANRLADVAQHSAESPAPEPAE